MIFRYYYDFGIFKGMELYRSIIIPILAKSYKEISKTQKNLGKNKEFTSELYSFSKPLYQPSHNAAPVLYLS